MVDQRLLDYVKDLKSKGFTEEQIKQQLIQAGYAEQILSELFPKTSFKKYFILLFAIASVALILSYIIPILTKETIVSVKTIVPNKNINIKQPLSYKTKLQSNTKTDALVKTEIVDFQTSKILYSAKEKITIKNEQDLSKSLKLNESYVPGKYLIRINVMYGNKKTGTSEEFVVIPEEIKAVIDKKPTAELQLPKPESKIVFAETCPTACNDYNVCTTDSCVKGKCEYTSIVPCCGNLNCEEKESILNCPSDCVRKTQTDDEKIVQAKETVSSDKEKSAAICNTVADTAKFDSCFSELADISSTHEFCMPIGDLKSRDGCYVSLSLKGAFACGNIEDRLFRQSCQSMESNKNLMIQMQALQGQVGGMEGTVPV